MDDLSDLIDCMDFGFHQSLYRAVMMHSSGLDQIRRSLQMDNDSLDKTLAGMKFLIWRISFKNWFFSRNFISRSISEIKIFDIFLGLDSRLDKQRFFESNNATFMIPKKFEYNPVRRDESESLVQKSVMDELEARKQKLKERLATLKVDSEGTHIQLTCIFFHAWNEWKNTQINIFKSQKFNIERNFFTPFT